MHLFCFLWYGHPRALHSFPTRRSSDLEEAVRMRGDSTLRERPRRRGSDRRTDQGRRMIRGRRRETVEVPVERSEEHTSELQSRLHLVCRLLLEKKKNTIHPLHAHGS